MRLKFSIFLYDYFIGVQWCVPELSFSIRYSTRHHSCTLICKLQDRRRFSRSFDKLWQVFRFLFGVNMALNSIYKFSFQFWSMFWYLCSLTMLKFSSDFWSSFWKLYGLIFWYLSAIFPSLVLQCPFSVKMSIRSVIYSS